MKSLYLDGFDSQLHAANRLNTPLLHIIDMSKRFLIKSLLDQHLHSFLQHAKRYNLSPKVESQRPTFAIKGLLVFRADSKYEREQEPDRRYHTS